MTSSIPHLNNKSNLGSKMGPKLNIPEIFNYLSHIINSMHTCQLPEFNINFCKDKPENLKGYCYSVIL